MQKTSLKLAVIGDPVAHSLSPSIHRAALMAAGLEGSYEAIKVEPEDLRAEVGRLREAGYAGFNVTIPHKTAILPLLDMVDAVSRSTGAVNTVRVTAVGLEGFNTDVGGIRSVLDARVGEQGWANRVAIVLGTGGAARAAVTALQQNGSEVVVAARSRQRARDALPHVNRILALAEVSRLQTELDRAMLLINATSVGMGRPEESPLPDGCLLPPRLLVCDLVYSPRCTRLLRTAEAAGCRTADGIEFLIAQAAQSFVLWTGVEPDLAAMRRACQEPAPSGATAIGAG
ncbi:MAG TPA: shikimate dehydrogenase [Chloroflexota bacterium]|nr:shikimate dehydrogenase [Chloroflexota bacterium]